MILLKNLSWTSFILNNFRTNQRGKDLVDLIHHHNQIMLKAYLWNKLKLRTYISSSNHYRLFNFWPFKNCHRSWDFGPDCDVQHPPFVQSALWQETLRTVGWDLDFPGHGSRSVLLHNLENPIRVRAGPPGTSQLFSVSLQVLIREWGKTLVLHN